MADNLCVEIEELKKGGASSTIGEAKAKATELMRQLKDTEQCLADLTKHLKEAHSSKLSRELDAVEIRSSELVKKVTIAIEEACMLKSELDDEPSHMLEYREEAAIDYKACVRFWKGLDRTWHVLYQYEYQIILVYFRVRYPRLEVKEDPFMDYIKD
ncbi:hypothetical protein GW17_00038758 [Ensete ventricosum]|nr:hypothetical protein GW17_00038758 [Ensete ventricosum]